MTVFYIAILTDEPEVISKKSLRDLALYIRDHNLERRVGNVIMAGADIFTRQITGDLEYELQEIESEYDNQNNLISSYYR